ncbi:porin [Paracidovorax cattleyae]|uniref:porin n=1 Tax=Paracidovorax cattleyae TaxID=80868 RepID=UPI001FC98949|nr:porin [Paracidovorax cattleyae]
MKSTLAALLAALPCIVSAQSSVTIFGVLDAGVASIRNEGSARVTGLVSGGSNTSRLGFRGKEDLGSGLAASFWLEGELQVDDGNATGGFNFVRRSTVSLSGRFGEMRLGRDFTPTYLSMNPFDAWRQRGFGMLENFGPARGSASVAYQRLSNSVAYFLPEGLGGLYGSAMYGFGEQPSDKAVVANAAGLSTNAANATTRHTGNYLGARVGYSRGPVNVAVSYGEFKDVVRTVAPSSYADSYRLGNVAGEYDFGVATANLFYQQERMAGRASIGSFGFDTLAAGLTVPLGSHTLRAQYARYHVRHSGNDLAKLAFGYLYNFSKRTWVYADVARMKNEGRSAVTLGGVGNSLLAAVPQPGGKSTGVSVGIRHSF